MNSAALGYRSLSLSEPVEDIGDSIAEETAVPVQLCDEQRAELRRRLAEHRVDPDSSIAWEQVRANLFKGQP